MNNELIKELKVLLHYDNGKLFWKKTLGTRAIVGKEAGSYKKDGYCKIRIYGCFFTAHRIIWAFHYGEIGQNEVVHHKDENPSNNEISNLKKMTVNKHNKIHKKPQKSLEFAKEQIRLMKKLKQENLQE